MAKHLCPCGCGRSLGRFDRRPAEQWIKASSTVELADHFHRLLVERNAEAEDIAEAVVFMNNVDQLVYALEGWMHHEDRGFKTTQISAQTKRLDPVIMTMSQSMMVLDDEWLEAWAESMRQRAVAFAQSRVLSPALRSPIGTSPDQMAP